MTSKDGRVALISQPTNELLAFKQLGSINHPESCFPNVQRRNCPEPKPIITFPMHRASLIKERS